MKQVVPVALLSSFLVACTGAGGEALLRLDTRAIQALRADLDLTTGRLDVTCADGRAFTVPVTLDAPEEEFTIAVPACGDARVDFQFLSAVGIPELRGSSDARLVPGFVDIEIPVRYVGQLSLKLADDSTADSCVAVVERTSPDREVVESALALSRSAITTLIVPVGSYDVTCDGRLAQPLVAAGINVSASLPDPAPGPRLVSTTLQPTYPASTTRIDVTFTFSTPVTGFDGNSVSIDNDGAIQAVTGTGASYTVAFATLSVATDYAITLSQGIVDAQGIPLIGAPVTLRFSVLANAYYVATTGNDSGNTGLTPSSPWRNIAFAVSNVSTPALIHVAGGIYDEQVFPANDMTIEGGWSADFATRDVLANVTRLRYSDQTLYFSDTTNTAVDGLTIEGTFPQQVVVMQGADVALRNCVITGASTTAFTVGYGIVIEGIGFPSIINNTITLGGGASSTQAIHLALGASARVIHNTINAGNASSVSGVWLDNDIADVSIVNNLFIGTSTSNTRVGITGNAPPTALMNNAFSSEHDDGYRNAAGTGLVIGAAGDFGFAAPHRFSGNVVVGQAATLVDAGQRPVSSALDIGIDTTTADCGFTDTSYPCNGPARDRAGQARTAPPTVGAYESTSGT
ncbi:MAG: hypothetical protein ACAI38_07005 [Myxococcota bacterium]|nr:right-handed parallel beta-helix repeat-containing protein [Myxococcota bacterium]